MTMIIGIDLGTTNSAAAHMTDDGPRLIPNALGHTLTPSVVGIDENGELLVGRAAKEFQVGQPTRCAALFKRDMGTERTFELADKKFTAEELSSLVLRTLKLDAEEHLGHAIERAVITVPAYFNDLQRKATIRAGQRAGLTVERIINEPTAAAIAYGLHEEEAEKIVAVIDLGGGTFDVSVVEIFEGSVEVRASSGACFLGGEDFTRTLAARLMESRGYLFERAELDYPAMVSRMIQLCEKAKIQLASRDSTVVRFPDEQGEVSDGAPELTVTGTQFQDWTKHILAQIELPIRRGLGDAGLKRSDLNEVILVGGATRGRAVIERVTGLLGQSPHSRLNPDEVVALGAAVQAGLVARHQRLDDMVVTDVCPFTLGIEVSKKIGTERRSGYFLPIINRNTTIPISRVNRVSTVHANQREIKVCVYQGESRKVKDNLWLGEFQVEDIPLAPAGQEVDVRLTYDLNGVLEVEAEVVETKKKQSIVISEHAHQLSEAAIAKALEEMQALKTHPREETTNRFLLKRAERVYRELPLSEREELADLMVGFEEALESQEANVIERFHDALNTYLDQFDFESDN